MGRLESGQHLKASGLPAAQKKKEMISKQGQMRMKKIVILILAGASAFGCSACQRTSVQEAVNINASFPYVRELGDEGKPELEAGEGQQHTEDAVDGDSEKNRTSGVALGETCTYNDFEVTVQQVWMSKNLLLLDELEGNDRFRKFLIAQNNYGEVNTYDETGKNIRRERQWIFIKIRIKNIAASEEPRTVILSPMFYNRKEGNEYVRIPNEETYGYDKYEKLDNLDGVAKDILFYRFAAGDVLETILAVEVADAEGALEDVYMSTGFLKEGGESVGQLTEGSYMLRLNIVENHVTEE